MIINETTKLEGYIVGIGKVKTDGTEEFKWLDNPKHNRIVSTGLDHLLCYNGSITGFYTTPNANIPKSAIWLGNLNTHYGALSFCKIGTGKNETQFTDTDLQTPVTSLTSNLRTGIPFCGTKCTEFGKYILRVSHTSGTVSSACKIWEVGLFGQYGTSPDIVNPMFARIKLDKGIELLAGESLVFTYELHITCADIEQVDNENFFDLLDSTGEPLKYSRKLYFNYATQSSSYSDTLRTDIFIQSDGTEKDYLSTSEYKYFYRLPVYFYNSILQSGDFDSLGYSTSEQNWTVANSTLSKARSDSLANNYTHDVLDYEGVGTKDKHRDITICLGLYSPNMDEPDEFTDIFFLRIRGMNYKFGHYEEDSETHEQVWVSQALRKWANQTMTFIIRYRYVTEDTLDIDGNDPDAVEP